MIDTIVLTLQPENFRILDHNRFSPSTARLFQPPYYELGHRANFKCVQNPTSEELKKGIYKPRLTVTKQMNPRGLVTVLRIEFSIPKLLFGNNFDEVDGSEFEQIITRLHNTLDSMGALVFPQVLRDAPVSTIHYSKNIVLTDYSTPSTILKELSKINLNEKLDLNQTDFRNEGHSLKFHANSFEVALYDKRKDLQKAKISEKRAIERDNAIQLELFDQWKPKKPFEVLRMEIRLNQRAKIKQIFKKIQINSDLTFSSVFKEAISKKVLLLHFSEIEKSYAIIPHRPKTNSQLVADIKVFNPKIKIRKMLQLVGTIILINDIGIRGFREAIAPYGPHHWNRLKNDLSYYSFPEEALSPVKVIEQALKEFKPLRLKDYPLNSA